MTVSISPDAILDAEDRCRQLREQARASQLLYGDAEDLARRAQNAFVALQLGDPDLALTALAGSGSTFAVFARRPFSAGGPNAEPGETLHLPLASAFDALTAGAADTTDSRLVDQMRSRGWGRVKFARSFTTATGTEFPEGAVRWFDQGFCDHVVSRFIAEPV